MDLNFDRSVVLGALINNPDGSVTVCPEFSFQRITIPSKNVRYQVTKKLDDSSVVVVDLGPCGLLTDEIVIGVGHIEDITQSISHDPDFEPFDKFLLGLNGLK